MHDQIRTAELFKGLSAGRVQRLASIGRVLALRTGEYLFLLGDAAQYVSVVTSGQSTVLPLVWVVSSKTSPSSLRVPARLSAGPHSSPFAPRCRPGPASE